MLNLSPNSSVSLSSTLRAGLYDRLLTYWFDWMSRNHFQTEKERRRSGGGGVKEWERGEGEKWGKERGGRGGEAAQHPGERAAGGKVPGLHSRKSPRWFAPNFPRVAMRRKAQKWTFSSAFALRSASMPRMHTLLKDLNFEQSPGAPSCRRDFMTLRRDFCTFFLAERENPKVWPTKSEEEESCPDPRGWVGPGHVLMQTRASSVEASRCVREPCAAHYCTLLMFRHVFTPLLSVSHPPPSFSSSWICLHLTDVRPNRRHSKHQTGQIVCAQRTSGYLEMTLSQESQEFKMLTSKKKIF